MGFGLLFFFFFNLGVINLEKESSLQHTDRFEVEVASFHFKCKQNQLFNVVFL